jgi:plasmid maintenance system antidote protein VapI
MFLNLSAQIEGQLRDAYDRKFEASLATQSSLAKKLGINRSAVHKRLMGHTNMTTETIANMVWALDHAIKVEIYDLALDAGQNFSISQPEDTKSAKQLPPDHIGTTSGKLRVEELC